jgi:hypothetical protein
MDLLAQRRIGLTFEQKYPSAQAHSRIERSADSQFSFNFLAKGIF